ncbi:MAG: L,D-transpeptidase family protein [Ginsengibacter sp.]
MQYKTNLIGWLFLITAVSFVISCKGRHVAPEKEIVKKPEDMDDQVAGNIKAVIQFAKDNNGKINDSVKLSLLEIVAAYYDQNENHNIWSRKEKWVTLADSMFSFIETSKYYGLYPADYHLKDLAALRQKLVSDSLAKTDAIIWTRADLMLTDAFMKIAKDIKEGRLLPDSTSIISKQKYIDSFFVEGLNQVSKNHSIAGFINTIEPSNDKYLSLRGVLKNFVDSMDNTSYQYVDYPQKDSLLLVKNIQKRLEQSGAAKIISGVPDSLLLNTEIKKYQAVHGINKDGKISSKFIRNLNNTDLQKFKRIAITLDRYKLLPPALPERYIWVNLPGFYLKLWDHDTLVLESKVIVGKPTTRTPVLASQITDMVTYPQWTIPESIIRKDILPAMKKDPGYLTKKGYNLVDGKGEVVDPYTVKWTKYSKGIPWKVMQGSGDDNALGIFKFNFNNPFSVYLHDTNQRYLFKNSVRALSHGCVRVQNWEELAFYIARNDSLNQTGTKKLAYNVDSIKTWLANKDRKRIIVKNRLPLFIEYYTCEVKKDKVVFYDDIYDDDKMLADKYFKNK